MRIFGTNESGEMVYLADSSVLHPNVIMELERSGTGYFSFYPPPPDRHNYTNGQAPCRIESTIYTVTIKHCRFFLDRRLVNKYYLIDNPREAARFAKTFGKNKEMTDKPWRAENGK